MPSLMRMVSLQSVVLVQRNRSGLQVAGLSEGATASFHRHLVVLVSHVPHITVSWSLIVSIGADNVIELTAVTPTGDLVTANNFTNTDLFWALRGGGGPSFGVATSITYQVHPQTPLYASFFEANTTSTESFIALLDSWHAALPGLADAGWSGYYPFENGSYFALMYLLPNGTTEKGNATLGAWIKNATAIPGVTIKTDATTTYANFQDWFVANILDPVDVIGFNYTGGASLGGGIDTASWLLPRNLFSDPVTAHNMSVAYAAIPFGIGQ